VRGDQLDKKKAHKTPHNPRYPPLPFPFSGKQENRHKRKKKAKSHLPLGGEANTPLPPSRHPHLFHLSLPHVAEAEVHEANFGLYYFFDSVQLFLNKSKIVQELSPRSYLAFGVLTTGGPTELAKMTFSQS
jgi:hypothetical protein